MKAQVLTNVFVASIISAHAAASPKQAPADMKSAWLEVDLGKPVIELQLYREE